MESENIVVSMLDSPQLICLCKVEQNKNVANILFANVLDMQVQV